MYSILCRSPRELQHILLIMRKGPFQGITNLERNFFVQGLSSFIFLLLFQLFPFFIIRFRVFSGTYMKKYTNRVATTNGVVILLQVLFECFRISCFYFIHAHMVQSFNRFVYWPMFLVVVHVVEPKAHIRRNSEQEWQWITLKAIYCEIHELNTSYTSNRHQHKGNECSDEMKKNHFLPNE